MSEYFSQFKSYMYTWVTIFCVTLKLAMMIIISLPIEVGWVDSF